MYALKREMRLAEARDKEGTCAAVSSGKNTQKKVERLIDMFGKFPLDLTPENLSKMRGDEHNKHFSLVAKKSGLRET